MIPAVAGAASSAAGFPYLWVLAGGAGNLYTSTSTTASSWTAQTSSFSTTNINDVTSDGLSQYVAVGDSGKLATSPDGITWTQRTSTFGTSAIYGIAWGNNLWVAVGGPGKIATSTDGITWTARTSGTTGILVAVAYGNGVFVASTQGGAFFSSTNGITWTARTSTLAECSFNGIAYAKTQGVWVAGNDSSLSANALASSTDGLTWTARNSAYTLNAFCCFANNTTVIAQGNYITVATPGTSDIQTSTNGTTWTDRTPANASCQMKSMAADDGGLIVAAGTNGSTNTVLQSSTDGTTWTSRTGPAIDFEPMAFCHSSGKGNK